MTRQTLRFWLLILTLALPAAAAPILTLTPFDGGISGPPGGAPTWIVAVTDDAGAFPVVGGVDYVTLVPLGNFSFSFINDWSAVGTYDIDPFAVPGALSEGTIEVLFELFSVSPTDLNFDPELHSLGISQLSAGASVLVESSAVPEPSYAALVGLLLTGLVARKTRSARRRQSSS